jgi:hypothetical protein
MANGREVPREPRGGHGGSLSFCARPRRSAARTRAVNCGRAEENPTRSTLHILARCGETAESTLENGGRKPWQRAAKIAGWTLPGKTWKGAVIRRAGQACLAPFGPFPRPASGIRDGSNLVRKIFICPCKGFADFLPRFCSCSLGQLAAGHLQRLRGHQHRGREQLWAAGRRREPAALGDECPSGAR